MSKRFKVVIRGKQRRVIEADLMAQLVLMMASQLSQQDAFESAPVTDESPVTRSSQPPASGAASPSAMDQREGA
jgi:hypothetical protein